MRGGLGEDSAAVACDVRVDPGFVDVAVECFLPLAACGEADPVLEAVVGREVGYDEDVLAFSFYPALEGEHAVVIVGVHDLKTLSAKRG